MGRPWTTVQIGCPGGRRVTTRQRVALAGVACVWAVVKKMGTPTILVGRPCHDENLIGKLVGVPIFAARPRVHTC